MSSAVPGGRRQVVVVVAKSCGSYDNEVGFAQPRRGHSSGHDSHAGQSTNIAYVSAGDGDGQRGGVHLCSDASAHCRQVRGPFPHIGHCWAVSGHQLRTALTLPSMNPAPCVVIGDAGWLRVPPAWDLARSQPVWGGVKPHPGERPAWLPAVVATGRRITVGRSRRSRGAGAGWTPPEPGWAFRAVPPGGTPLHRATTVL